MRGRGKKGRLDFAVIREYQFDLQRQARALLLVLGYTGLLEDTATIANRPQLETEGGHMNRRRCRDASSEDSNNVNPSSKPKSSD
jgi:hypothetical protein